MVIFNSYVSYYQRVVSIAITEIPLFFSLRCGRVWPSETSVESAMSVEETDICCVNMFNAKKIRDDSCFTQWLNEIWPAALETAKLTFEANQARIVRFIQTRPFRDVEMGCCGVVGITVANFISIWKW